MSANVASSCSSLLQRPAIISLQWGLSQLDEANRKWRAVSIALAAARWRDSRHPNHLFHRGFGRKRSGGDESQFDLDEILQKDRRFAPGYSDVFARLFGLAGLHRPRARRVSARSHCSVRESVSRQRLAANPVLRSTCIASSASSSFRIQMRRRDSYRRSSSAVDAIPTERSSAIAISVSFSKKCPVRGRRTNLCI
jgi:hypothetical protein